ncbi:hypothetical protein CF326_g8668 [Tilletia indica]|nr:hypothetical protein CF326_g8668 [Tilletia indica]
MAAIEFETAAATAYQARRRDQISPRAYFALDNIGYVSISGSFILFWPCQVRQSPRARAHPWIRRRCQRREQKGCTIIVRLETAEEKDTADFWKVLRVNVDTSTSPHQASRHRP